MRRQLFAGAFFWVGSLSTPLAGFNSDSFADNAYDRGLEFYYQGHDREAANWFYKYLTWMETTGEFNSDGRVDIALEHYETCLATIEISEPIDDPVPFEVLRKPARRGGQARRRPVEKKSKKEPPPDNSAGLSKRARSAREQGQLEYSLRLYRLALEQNPESAEIRAAVQDLERDL